MNGLTDFRDIKSIVWGATLQLNLMRSVAAGIVWTVLMLLFGPGDMPFASRFIPLIGFPVWWMCFATFGLVAAKIMTTFAGALGELGVKMFFFIFGLALAVGDPLMHLLSQKKPELVPVENYPTFKPALWMFVRKLGWQAPPEQ